MRAKLIHEDAQRTFVVVFDKGDEVVEGLQTFVDEQRLDAASFTAIGAFTDVELGYFDRESNEYASIPVREQVEVLSLIGNVALNGEKRQVHAHVVVGKRDGSAHGGHLLKAHVWPTLEVVVVESPAHLRRAADPTTGLTLIRL